MMMNNFSTMNLFTHHKGGGSTANGRNSAGRRLGAKCVGGQAISAGSVIYRQRGIKIHPDKNAGIGGGDTLSASINDVIRFGRLGKTRKQVSVYPAEEVK